MKLEFEVKQQTVKLLGNNILISESKNYVYAHFSFTEDWAELVKSVIFKQGDSVFITLVLDQTDSCLVPKELLVADGEFTVHLVGRCEDVIITSNPLKVFVKGNDVITNDNSGAPSVDFLTESVLAVKRYRDESESFASAAEASKEESAVIVNSIKDCEDSAIAAAASASESAQAAANSTKGVAEAEERAKGYANEAQQQAKSVAGYAASAEDSANSAENSAKGVTEAIDSIGDFATAAVEAATVAHSSAVSAAGSAAAAAASVQSIGDAEEIAAAAAEVANKSATAAAASAAAAAGSENKINTDLLAAKTAAQEAGLAKDNAVAAADSVMNNIQAAIDAKAAAASSATSAANSATAANASKTAAATSATNAKTSETKAANSATAAAESALTASNKAATATTEADRAKAEADRAEEAAALAAAGSITEINGMKADPDGKVTLEVDSAKWSKIESVPEFALVATSGKYSDLTGLPPEAPSVYTKSVTAEADGKVTVTPASGEAVVISDFYNALHLGGIPSDKYALKTDVPAIPTSYSWDSITGAPTFAKVATSGKYSDLIGAPYLDRDYGSLRNDNRWMGEQEFTDDVKFTGINPIDISSTGIKSAGTIYKGTSTNATSIMFMISEMQAAFTDAGTILIDSASERTIFLEPYTTRVTGIIERFILVRITKTASGALRFMSGSSSIVYVSGQAPSFEVGETLILGIHLISSDSWRTSYSLIYEIGTVVLPA